MSIEHRALSVEKGDRRPEKGTGRIGDTGPAPLGA